MPRPFANRTLHPYAAAWVAASTGIDLHAVFLAIAVGATILLCVCVAAALARHQPRALLVLPMATPLAVTMFRDYYLPDLFHASILAAFLLTINGGLWIPALLLFILHLTRESTVLVSVFAIAVKLLRRERRHLVLWTAAAVLGLGVQVYLGRRGLPNVHGVNEFAYLVLKVPFNGLKNLFGLTVWTNTTPSACHPVWRVAAGPLTMGGIEQVGLCAWSVEGPLFTVSSWLTLFGVAPLLCLMIFHRGGRELVARLTPAELVSTGYGATAFLLGPFLGASIDWLVGYGWPAFWIGAPLLLSRVAAQWSPRLSALHLVTAWLPLGLNAVLPRPAALGAGALIGLAAGLVASRSVRSAAVTENST